MPKVARLGDTSDHGGGIISSCSKWRDTGQLIARKGDTFDCPIHGPNPIITGSGKWKCEGQEIARNGDETQCGAKLIAGGKWDID